MAAFTEYQQSPWLTSINSLLSRTQKNLQHSRRLSQNRSKSFFLNSSDLQSTNFSLDKQDQGEYEIEIFKKEILSEIDENVGKNQEDLSQYASRIRRLEASASLGRKAKEIIFCDIEKFEINFMKKISQVRAQNFATLHELDFVKMKLLADQEERTEILNERLRKVPRHKTDFEEVFSQIKTFPHKLLKKSKFSRFCQKQAEVSENISKTCEDLKRNCKRQIRKIKHAGNKEEIFTRITSDNSLNFDCEILKKGLNDISFHKEAEIFKEKSEKIKKVTHRINENEKLLKHHEEQAQIMVLKKKISNEMNEIENIEEKVSELADRLVRLKTNKRRNLSQRQKPPENFTRININYMGESDEDSISLTSPTPSPLNQRLHTVNSTKHTSKNFKFNGDIIPENPDEYERFSPDIEKKN